MSSCLSPSIITVSIVVSRLIFLSPPVPQLLSVSLTWTSYTFALILIRQERNYLLPSVPSRGHGLVLLIFFTLIFISENLTFINVRHEDWWFMFKK